MQMHRLDMLIAKLPRYKIDGLLVVKPVNIFYLTSFDASNAWLVVTQKARVIITDFIYSEAASNSLPGFGIYVSPRDFAKTLSSVVKKYRIKRLGFEGRFMSVAQYKRLSSNVKRCILVNTTDIVESLREIKDRKEIAALKKALNVTASTWTELKRHLVAGISESSIAHLIKEMLVRNGSDGYAFEPIVATQPSSSQPHYIPTAKKLVRNSILLVDMGARLRYYNSDLTRMYRLGKISSKFAKLYSILCDAQRYAIDCIKPGIKTSDVDRAARQYLTSKGVGKFFGHALGHGIGLETHEKPSLSHSSKGVLKEDMVFTVEPGIYMPGFGGLRVEDTVRVRKGGCEVLSDDIDKSI